MERDLTPRVGPKNEHEAEHKYDNETNEVELLYVVPGQSQKRKQNTDDEVQFLCVKKKQEKKHVEMPSIGVTGGAGGNGGGCAIGTTGGGRAGKPVPEATQVFIFTYFLKV